MGSMFEKFNQLVEYRFQNLSEKINQLKTRMDMYDLTTTTPHDTQGPSTNSMNNTSTEIKEILKQGVEDITFEVKAQSLRICKLKDCKKFDDDYVTGLDILRGEFGRLRGLAKAFTNI